MTGECNSVPGADGVSVHLVWLLQRTLTCSLHSLTVYLKVNMRAISITLLVS